MKDKNKKTHNKGCETKEEWIRISFANRRGIFCFVVRNLFWKIGCSLCTRIFVHPNFCPELAFFPYALGHLRASAAHSSPIIHTTTKPTAHVFPTEGICLFLFLFVLEHCSEKGECRCKGGNPRRICVTERLPVQLELCLAESALPWSSVVCGSDATAQSSNKRKKLRKGAMLNPKHAQCPAPNSSRSPKRDEKSATSPNRRENDRMSASTHETAARTQFFGALFMSRTLSSSVLLQSTSPKTLLSAVSRGFWPNDVEFCDASRPFPTEARGTAGRASFSAPTHAGPQGERSKKVRGGLFGPVQEVEKWHFSRVIGAQKRAPHRRKTHPRKRCAKNGPKEGSKAIIAHRFFGRKHFSHFFGHPVFRQKTKRPKTGPGRETRRNEAFFRFSLRGRTTKTRKNVQNDELRGSPKRIEKRDFLRFFRLTGRPEKQNDTFFDSFRDLSKPLFL